MLMYWDCRIGSLGHIRDECTAGIRSPRTDKKQQLPNKLNYIHILTLNTEPKLYSEQHTIANVK